MASLENGGAPKGVLLGYVDDPGVPGEPPRSRRPPPQPLFAQVGVLLTVHQVEALLGVSKATVYRMVARGEFPRPIHISAGTTRWKSEDYLLWYRTRQAGDALP